MSAMAAAGIVVGGLLVLAAVGTAIAGRDWRAGAAMLGITVGATALALVATYLMAALMGDTELFFAAFRAVR